MKGCSSLQISSRMKAIGRAGLVLRGASGALQHGLGEFERPVAEHVPDEAIGGDRRLVELVGLDARPSPRRPPCAHSPSAHLLSVCLAPAGSNPSTRTQPFISAKRAAFQILVAKLR